MGRSSRTRPKHLARKLKQIRESLGLSQDGVLVQLGVDKIEGLEHSVISAYELDKKESTLAVLLAHARVANIYVDVLIDDELCLPNKTPACNKKECLKT